MFPLLQTADVIILCDRNNVTQLRDIQVVSRNLHNRLAPQGTVSVCNRKRTTWLLKNKTKSQPVGRCSCTLTMDPSLYCGPERRTGDVPGWTLPAGQVNAGAGGTQCGGTDPLVFQKPDPVAGSRP